ncbi:hypothetical protein BRARA_E01784 [Brassica rapa]|uniref:DUF4283 domain-containing protein n=1 Tax=Brassica campestris TaxID=3711 RepID=A0A397ZJZ9_BRACM|nr:hypothetical protein BRARA_E01784 [Brassica rapa]
MSDYHRFLLKDIELGLDETPIVLPPVLCAQAVYLNCFSIINVLVNPEKKMRGLINQMPCIWGITDEVIGRIINTKKFQFLFKTEEALNKVLSRGPWLFADWMIVTKRWDATLTEDNLKMVQLWVQIKGIPPHYLSRAIIEFIGDTLAQVVDVKFEDSLILTDCVWVLVNYYIDNPLLFKHNYQFGIGEIFTLSFLYDRLKNFLPFVWNVDT